MLFSIQKLTRINQRLLTIAWLILGISIFGATQLCSTIWAFANPTPHHWDNAIYLNHAARISGHTPTADPPLTTEACAGSLIQC